MSVVCVYVSVCHSVRLSVRASDLQSDISAEHKDLFVEVWKGQRAAVHDAMVDAAAWTPTLKVSGHPSHRRGWLDLTLRLAGAHSQELRPAPRAIATMCRADVLCCTCGVPSCALLLLVVAACGWVWAAANCVPRGRADKFKNKPGPQRADRHFGAANGNATGRRHSFRRCVHSTGGGCFHRPVRGWAHSAPGVVREPGRHRWVHCRAVDVMRGDSLTLKRRI